MKEQFVAKSNNKMLNKTPLALYYGNICPAENSQSLMEEYTALHKKMYQHYEDFSYYSRYE